RTTRRVIASPVSAGGSVSMSATSTARTRPSSSKGGSRSIFSRSSADAVAVLSMAPPALAARTVPPGRAVVVSRGGPSPVGDAPPSVRSPRAVARPRAFPRLLPPDRRRLALDLLGRRRHASCETFPELPPAFDCPAVLGRGQRQAAVAREAVVRGEEVQ